MSGRAGPALEQGVPMVLDGYVRVSQVQGRSGERFMSPVVQREQIERWAELRGAFIGHVFEELDESGGRRDRALLMQAVKRVERGESDGLVVAYLSRFGRSHLDGLTTIDRITKAGGVFSPCRRASTSRPTWGGTCCGRCSRGRSWSSTGLALPGRRRGSGRSREGVHRAAPVRLSPHSVRAAEPRPSRGANRDGALPPPGRRGPNRGPPSASAGVRRLDGARQHLEHGQRAGDPAEPGLPRRGTPRRVRQSERTHPSGGRGCLEPGSASPAQAATTPRREDAAAAGNPALRGLSAAASELSSPRGDEPRTVLVSVSHAATRRNLSRARAGQGRPGGALHRGAVLAGAVPRPAPARRVPPRTRQAGGRSPLTRTRGVQRQRPAPDDDRSGQIRARAGGASAKARAGPRRAVPSPA
jgi:hypothetical protein